MATWGAYLLGFATLIFVFNWFRSLRHGAPSGNDPWGGATLEWTLPSPPPPYNFAKIPTVSSRYPLWDVKSPYLTSDVPHTPTGERRIDVEIEGHKAGHISTPHDVASTASHVPTAEELGIAMPTPTVKPLVAAAGLSVAFVGLISGKHLPIMLLGAAIFVSALYAWLLTPLEPEH
jgi:hypothetical protein